MNGKTLLILAVIAGGIYYSHSLGQTTANSTTVLTPVPVQAETKPKENPPANEAKANNQTQSNTLPDISQGLPAQSKGKSFYQKASSACMPALVETTDEAQGIAECKSLKGRIYTVTVK
jgi:hypothetical protein